MKHLLLILAICGLCIGADKADSYSNDFEKTPLGMPPEDLMILNGAFTVVQVENNKCLELTADPLDGDGLLFGPKGRVTGTVARIWGAATGQRFPEFGVGANDSGGYKLIVVPSTGTLELRKGEDAKTSVPYVWKSGTWTRFRLHITQLAGDKFQIDGKAWADGSPEPKDWSISAQDSDAPLAGRASVWGMPYSGEPIRFDDLTYDPR